MESINWWQAALLGLVQGLTEFIPVSSSGHLNIMHRILGQERNLTFDLMLHIGTLCALIFYYWRDWVGLLRDPEKSKLRNLVFLACVPAVLVGVVLRDLEEAAFFQDIRNTAIALIVAGVLLWIADRVGRKQRELQSTNLMDAIIIGCSQAAALVPGVSRSGATITAGLFRGMTREASAGFSFLLSLPITLGAVVYDSAKRIADEGSAPFLAAPAEMALGIVVSAVSGFWAIGFLLNYLKTRDVTPFVLWRIFVAILVFTLLPYLKPA